MYIYMYVYMYVHPEEGAEPQNVNKDFRLFLFYDL